MDKPTCVYLVGAGPGDPGLLTLAAKELLCRADVVVYDYLVDPRVVALAPSTARKEYVGKRGYSEHVTQAQINQLLIDIANTHGGCIVRLKGGDPFVFGRGGEEALALVEAGIPFKVVPAVTSGIAAPAYADIPVTHRGVSSSVTFVTGNEDPRKNESALDWNALAALAAKGSTLCFYMGVRNLSLISQKLQESGLDGSTPAALIQQGTTLSQKSAITTVARLAKDAAAAGIQAPAITLIGQVASLSETLGNRKKLPLEGKRIVVTRSRAEASALSAELRALGATTVGIPVIEQVAAKDTGALRDAVLNARSYDWIVFTSPNGAQYFFSEMDRQGLDVRSLAGCKIAAMGPGTASKLREHGIIADTVPSAYRAEALAEALIGAGAGTGTRVLIPRAEVARKELPQMLQEAGAVVDVVSAYQTVMPDQRELELLKSLLRDGLADAITVTSSSVAKHLYQTMAEEPELLDGVDVFSIGPITTSTMNELGIAVADQAESYDIEGLVRCIERYYEKGE